MATASHESSLEVRLGADQKDLIEQAAALSGQAVAEFAVSRLVEAARRVVDGQGAVRLSDRDWERFLKLLDNPPEPNEHLKRAAEHYRDNVKQ